MATLKYDFQIVGADAIAKAFKSVEDRAKEHSRKMDRVFSGAGGVGGGRKNWRSMIPAVPGMTESQRIVQNMIGLQKTAAAKIAGEKEKAAKRAADKEIKEAKRSADAQAREAKRVADAQIREDKRAAKERDRAEKRAAREQLRLDREQVALTNRKRMTTYNALTGLGQRAVGYASLGGGLLMGGIFAQGRAASKESSQLAMLAKQAGSKTSMNDLYKNISGAAKGVSTRYGADRTTVLATMRGFQGPAGAIEEGAIPMAGFMTAMAEATGADPTVTGELAGQIYRQLAQRGASAQEAMEQTKRLMGAFAFQSAQESIEYKDFAKFGPRILGAANRFGTSPEAYGRYAAVLGQVAQLAPQGQAVGAAESTISVSKIVQEAFKKRKAIKEGLGLNITKMGPEGLEELIAPEDLLSQLFAATGGDPAVLEKYGITTRGERAVGGLINLYKQGVAEGDKSLSPKERGALRIREYLSSAADKAITPEAIDKMVKEREEIDPFVKLEKAINRLINEGIDIIAPAVQDIAKAIEQGTPKILKFVEVMSGLVSYLAGNPLEAAFLAIIASVAKAKIGETITDIIRKQLPRVPGTQPPGVPPVPGTPGAPGGQIPWLSLFEKLRGPLALVSMAMNLESDAGTETEADKDVRARQYLRNFKETGRLYAETTAEGEYLAYGTPQEEYSALFERLGPERTALLYRAMGLGGMPVGSGGVTAGEGVSSGTFQGPLAEVATAAEAAAKTKQFADSLNPKAVETFNAALEQSASFLSGLATGGGLLNRGDAPGKPVASGGR